MSYKEQQKKVVEGKKRMFFLLIRAVFLTYETIAGKMTAQLRVDVLFCLYTWHIRSIRVFIFMVVLSGITNRISYIGHPSSNTLSTIYKK